MMPLTLVECPRDAMQGVEEWIPTATKIEYLNSLLKVGFDVLDFGSFVSPKVIPQLKDTAEVLEQLQPSETQLLAIVANTKGAEMACSHRPVNVLGFPLSLSETFQQRNTNKSIKEALVTIDEIMELCTRSGKELVVYLSMGFGNPYGDPYDRDTVIRFVDQLISKEVSTISLADTVGQAKEDDIRFLFNTLIPTFPKVSFGAHLHARADHAMSKLQAAWESGCRRFDTAMLGYGGCPMAGDQLTGNIDTRTLLTFLKQQEVQPKLDFLALLEAQKKASEVFHS